MFVKKRGSRLFHSFAKNLKTDADILFNCIEKRKAIIPTTVKKRKHAEEDDEEDDGDGSDDDLSWKTVSETFEQTHCKIINKSTFIKIQNNEVSVMSRPQLKTSYENMVYRTKDKKGKFKLENFIDAWTRNNPQQKCYDDRNNLFNRNHLYVLQTFSTCGLHSQWKLQKVNTWKRRKN